MGKDKKSKKDRDKDRDYDRDNDRYRDRSPERHDRRDREREPGRDREHRDYRDRDGDRDYERSGRREADRDYRDSRDHRDGRDHRDKDRDRDKVRDKDRDKDRDRGRDYRDRDRDKERERGSERRSGREGREESGAAGPSPSADAEQPAAKRRRGEDGAVDGGSGQQTGLAGDVAAALGITAEASAAGGAPGLTAEEAAQQRRDAETAALEAQAERRRKAVEEWRRKRLAEQGITEEPAQQQPSEQQQQPEEQQQPQQDGGDVAMEDADGQGGAERDDGAGAAGGPGGRANKGWSLEDDDEDDGGGDDGGGDDGGQDEEMDDGEPIGLRPPPAIKKEDDDDDDDPLDAFMAGMGGGGAGGRGKGMAAAAAAAARGKRLGGRAPGPLIGLKIEAAGVAGAGAAKAAAGPAVAPKVEVKQEAEPEAGAGVSGAEAEQAKPRRRWAPVAAAPAAAATAADDDEVDPLDAFMAAEVLPEVAKLAAEEAERRAASEAREVSPAPGEGGPGAMDVDVDVKPEIKTEPDLPGPSSRLSPAPVAGPSSRPGAAPNGGAARRKPRAAISRRRYDSSGEESSEGSDEDKEDEEMDDAEWARLVTAGKLSKGEKLVAVDHSTISYPPFRKNFYIEVTELSRMGEAELAEMRKELDGIKVRGKNIPAPVRQWTQAGLASRVIEVLRKRGFDRPLPIQAQSLPIIMSGRDCIGIAKTGSGKTMAFVLPMMRHIKDQPPLQQGDGPVALVIAPTRELVAQIAKEAKAFAKPLGLNALAVFGGSGVANQITELKRGVEIVSCTPGRMIDLLVTSNGKITNLRRVTYLVLDEADRMFDMGFEPQISRIVQNIRPDRQTVMFSATFPRQVESLARKILNDPVEIQVGGRSVVNDSITQWVEIRPDKERFHRLLEILGEWYDKGKLLIFVDKQESCDNLFRDLLRYGYPCLSLHGGKDQSDRESTIADFKGAVCNILVATSIAARGLDVKDLVLVINYDVPNHHEDYVHRVGRTGRAGAKGTAITFIGPDEERYAPDLVKALRESGAPIPQDLQALADSFHTKHKAGLVKAHGSGYGGSGFKFDRSEEEGFRVDKKAKAKAMGLEVEGEEDADEAALDAAVAALDADDIRPATAKQTTAAAGAGGDAAAAALGPMDSVAAVVAAAQARLAEAQKAGLIPTPIPGAAAPTAAAGAAAGAAAAPAAGAAGVTAPSSLVAAAQQIAARLSMAAGGPAAPMAGATAAGTAVPAGTPAISAAALQRAAAAVAAKFGATVAAPGTSTAGRTAIAPPAAPGFEVELEINDFPQHARWKITHRETMNQINELTGAALTVRGTYVPPGRPVPEGERKLFLLIEGPTEGHVKKAKAEIKKILEETTEKVMRRDAPAAGRYSVM